VVARTNPHSDVNVLGRAIFTTYLFAFEATALLLIIAVVGAVLLARRQTDVPDDTAGPPAAAEAIEDAPVDEGAQ